MKVMKKNTELAYVKQSIFSRLQKIHLKILQFLSISLIPLDRQITIINHILLEITHQITLIGKT